MKTIYNLIYHPKINFLLRNLLKNLSIFFPKKIRINPSGTITIIINNDQKIKLKTNQTSHITSQLFWEGSSNYEYSTIFNKLIQKVESFVDIGASIGFYSISAAILNPKLMIHSIEPSQNVMKYLMENIKLNNISHQITTHQLAFSDKNEMIDFYEVYNPKYPSTPNLSGEHNAGSKKIEFSKPLKVQSETFDNFVQRLNLKSLDLIKIDTEGFEALILQNAYNSIQDYKPIIICETLFNKIEQELERIMKSHEYEFYNHIGANQLKKVDSIVRKSDDGIRNCFFIPASKKYLLADFIV